MKSILKVLSIFVLGISSIMSMLPSINNSKTSVQQSYYDIKLPHEEITQDQEGYDMFANIQGIIKYHNKKAPLQSSLEYEFNQINSTRPYLESVTQLLNNYLEKPYYNFTIPKKFGVGYYEKQFFQAAISQVLLKNSPILLQGVGILPWWRNEKPVNFFASIYEVHSDKNDDPAAASYGVIDTIGSEKHFDYVLAENLFLLFQQASYIWIPSQNFDFMNKRMMIKPDVKNSFFNDVIDRNQDYIYVEQKIDLWQEAGIFSFSFFKNAIKRIHLLNSYNFYLWKDYQLAQGEEIWEVTEDMEEESEWGYDEKSSVVWGPGEYEYYITIDVFSKYRYEFQGLQLIHKIEVGSNNGAEVELPYIGISMGNIWVISWQVDDSYVI